MSQLVLETLSRRVETKQNRPKRVADDRVVFTALTAGKFLPNELDVILQVFECIGFNLPFRAQKHQDFKIHKR